MLDSFANALMQSTSEPPRLFVDPQSFNTQARFDVYRNNVHSSLIDAIRATFPVVDSLVGADAFTLLARRFVCEHPPQSPYLFEYGETFAGFLATVEQLSAYPYIPDVARLEFQLMSATHAEDKLPQNDLLLELAQQPERLALTAFRFVPSLRLIGTDYAAGAIWRAHQQAQVSLQAVDAFQPEWLMISRPGYTSKIDWLTQQEFEFVAALHAGRPVELALAGVSDELDLTICFQRLVTRGVIAGLVEG